MFKPDNVLIKKDRSMTRPRMERHTAPIVVVVIGAVALMVLVYLFLLGFAWVITHIFGGSSNGTPFGFATLFLSLVTSASM